MSTFSMRRLPFNPAGPFIARKPVRVAGIDFSQGGVVTAAQLTAIPARRLEQMWEARYFEMATPEQVAAHDEAVTFNHCEDCPDKEGCAALGACSAPKFGTCAVCGTPEACKAARSCTEEAKQEEELKEEEADDKGGEGAGGEEAPPAPPAPPAAAAKPVAIFHEGFGRWFTVDADGNKIGSKMTKAQAEATGLPPRKASEE